MTDLAKIEEVVSKLSSEEQDLLMGRCADWGSWMFTAGNYMVSLGLGTKRNGSIYFDTPLAADVIVYLKEHDNDH